MTNFGPFRTPIEAAHACVAAGVPIDIWTPGYMTHEGAKEIMGEISALYPERAIRYTAYASGLECGFVPN